MEARNALLRHLDAGKPDSEFVRPFVVGRNVEAFKILVILPSADASCLFGAPFSINPLAHLVFFVEIEVVGIARRVTDLAILDSQFSEFIAADGARDLLWLQSEGDVVVPHQVKRKEQPILVVDELGVQFLVGIAHGASFVSRAALDRGDLVDLRPPNPGTFHLFIGDLSVESKLDLFQRREGFEPIRFSQFLGGFGGGFCPDRSEQSG